MLRITRTGAPPPVVAHCARVRMRVGTGAHPYTDTGRMRIVCKGDQPVAYPPNHPARTRST